MSRLLAAATLLSAAGLDNVAANAANTNETTRLPSLSSATGRTSTVIAFCWKMPLC